MTLTKLQGAVEEEEEDLHQLEDGVALTKVISSLLLTIIIQVTPLELQELEQQLGDGTVSSCSNIICVVRLECRIYSISVVH